MVWGPAALHSSLSLSFNFSGRSGFSFIVADARRHAFEDEASLSRFVRRALLRRRSATRRIGVSYEAMEASPSVLPLLAQLGLAIRVPPAPFGARADKTPRRGHEGLEGHE
jgi:hypothetical protein